ncbi:hypothetical protein AAFF_G00266630 [Aldrovandia affinis]|uniref:Uncharacterized protein n=1 Tax=Aldrovandia affinis TaxID=143900 RepID=A0AAD7W2A8_9TELE|nr:hypothetical protein AAFF_G00266630 [Aldrovandia affinis]
MESVQIPQNRPALGPFLCSQGGPYSVPTPYGFYLDLDFLKYVEEIERGYQAPRAPRPRRRPSERTPPDGRVERTLAEVSRRLREAQRNPPVGPADSGGPDAPQVSPGNGSNLELRPLPRPRSALSPAHLQQPGPGDWTADAAGQLQALREELGVALQQLRSLGERAEREGRRSVAVGDDRPLEVRDAAVGAEPVETRETGVGTDGEAAEGELEELRHTVDIQRQRIHDLETRLSQARQEQEALGARQEQEVPRARQEQEALGARQEQEVLSQARQEQEALGARQEQEALGARQEQEVLRARQEQGKPQTTAEREVHAEALTGGTQVETGASLQCAWAGSDLDSSRGQRFPGFKGAGSVQSTTLQQNDQSTQTDSLPAVTSRGSQWESPDEEEEEEDRPTIHAVTNGGTTPSIPAAAMLKSIMKRRDCNGSSAPSVGRRKCLQFVGILNGRYESSSSEEEEDEEEGSSSGASGGGGGSDSSEGGAEPLEDTSSKEKSMNLDSDSDPEELRGAESEEESEKFELSVKMREACLILKGHLDDDSSVQNGDDVMSSSRTVELEWFRVSSGKAARPAHVTSYLAAFSEVFPGLLECVVNMADLNGNTALHHAVSRSNFSMVRLLLDTGVCRVDQENNAGYTPIMLAALATLRAADDMQVVRLLFRQGDVNAKARQAGHTALMLAVSHGRMEMVWALLDCGADVNTQDEEGSTALMCACQHGRAQIVSLLLQHPRCDITLVDNDGNTALSIALAASRSDIAVLLYTHMNRSIPPSPAPAPVRCRYASKTVPGRPPLPKKIGLRGALQGQRLKN